MLLYISEDPLACDLVGAEFLGYKNVFYLALALKRGLGELPIVSVVNETQNSV